MFEIYAHVLALKPFLYIFCIKDWSYRIMKQQNNEISQTVASITLSCFIRFSSI